MTMNTAADVAEEIRRALVKRQFLKAQSILEQGIVTLANQPAEIPDNPYDDPTPAACLGLGVRILQAIEEFYGAVTVGKLRRLVADGKLRNVPDIGELSERLIADAIVNYKPRRNIHGNRNHHG